MTLLVQTMIIHDYITMRALGSSGIRVRVLNTSTASLRRNQSFLSCKYETLSFDIRLRIMGFEFLPEANRKHWTLDHLPLSLDISCQDMRFWELLLSSNGLLLLEIIRIKHCNTTTIWAGETITPPFHSFPTYEIISLGFMWCHEKKKYWTHGQETDSAHISHVILSRIVNFSETPFFTITLLPYLDVWRINLLQDISKWLLSFKYHTRRLLLLLLLLCCYYCRILTSNLD